MSVASAAGGERWAASALGVLALPPATMLVLATALLLTLPTISAIAFASGLLSFPTQAFASLSLKRSSIAAETLQALPPTPSLRPRVRTYPLLRE